MKKLFLLNTITNFKEIIYDLHAVPFLKDNPDIEIYNIMDDTLLQETKEAGGITPCVIRRMYNYTLQAIERGADCVMGTCTSVNMAAKHIRPLVDIPVLNIDEPLAREAVKAGKKIGVLATLPTSPGAIIRLMQDAADEQGLEVEFVTKVADGAFDVLCAGDRAKHDEMVNENLYALAKEVDAIVFAQISMSLLKHDPVDVPLFKIGASGFEEAKRLMYNK